MSSTPAEQQRAFCRALIDGKFPEGLFAKGAEGSLPTRLGIYQGAYRSRLAEALQANYPMLHLVLGDEDFARLAGDFIASCPSRRPSIRWFGERLEGFLAERQDLLPHPALLDLVRLEWALCLAFDAADLRILASEDLAGLAAEDWPQLRLELHPSASLVALQWEVEPIWQALKADANVQTSPPTELDHVIVVWRKDLSPHWRSVSAMEASCLLAIGDGRDFAFLCEGAAQFVGSEQAAAEVVGLLQLWLADRLLVKR
jgi:hypothetical protein